MNAYHGHDFGIAGSSVDVDVWKTQMKPLEKRSILIKPLLTLTLNSGHRIFASGLQISRTYQGLLIGFPNDELNNVILRNIPTRYRKVFGELPVYVLPPLIERWEVQDTMDHLRQRVVAAMPKIEIAGLFECDTPVKPTGEGSALIIAWHQDEAILPLPDEIQHRLQALDWEAHAQNVDIDDACDAS